MSSTALTTWTIVALLGVITPGIDTMLVLRHTVLGGGRAGLSVLLGVALGCLVWATASLAGLTALLTASQLGYDIVRIAGACFLVWLGATTIWRTLPRNRRVDAPPDDVGLGESGIGDPRIGDPRIGDPRIGDGARRGLRTGFLANLLNPKVGVFYMSLLPQFLPTGGSATAWGVVLVAIHLAVSFVWYPLLIAWPPAPAACCCASGCGCGWSG